jgi:hypothetical protein
LSRLAAVALIASAVAVPLGVATPAQAVVVNDARDVSVYLAANTGGSGSYGMYVKDGSTYQVLSAESDTNNIYSAITSSNGSRLLYVQETSSADGEQLRSRLVVRDVSGETTPRFERVLSDLDEFGDVLDDGALISPDGNTVVYNHFDFAAEAATLIRTDVASGAKTILNATDYAGAFLDGNTLLVVNDAGTVRTLTISDKAHHAVTGFPVDPLSVDQFAVSPDGTKIAWVKDTTPDAAEDSTSEVQVSSIALTGGALAVTGTTTIAEGLENDSPSWSGDGSTISFVKYDGNVGPGSIYTVPADGSTTPVVQPVPDAPDVLSVAIGRRDSTAPGEATMGPITLAGTSAVPHWTLPADADLSGVLLTRTSPGQPIRNVIVAAPLTSYNDSGLVLGKTYTYSVTALDRSGNTNAGDATATGQMTALAATATFSDPTALKFYVNPNFRVYFGTVGTYSVQVRTNGTGALTPWLTDAHGASQVFSGAKAGYSYGFLLTVKDTFGNTSAPTGVGVAVVPYDQTKATFSGTYLTQSINDRYLGSATLLKAAGAAARIIVNGNRLQLLGERCTSCGVMDVYVDGVRVAGIDTRASQRTPRVVLYTRALTAGNHTVVVKSRGTAGRPNVVLDGFGVRH